MNFSTPSPPSLKRRILNAMYRARVFTTWQHTQPNSLSVLAYHRIDNPYQPDFDTFKPNVSATPEDFAAQMDYLQAHFNVVSLGQVIDWLQNKTPLPPHPALITFDDGYRDNYLHAYPVLKARNLPAVIFIATSCIGSRQPFVWDLIAYCFHHTPCTTVDLPLLGKHSWADQQQKEQVMLAWNATLKTIPDLQMRELVSRLPAQLDVTIHDNTFTDLHMTWDMVRELTAHRIDIAAHTVTHPILTKIDLDQTREEVSVSKVIIEEQIGNHVVSFAYPSGLTAHYDNTIKDILRQTGYKLAFTLLPGPSRQHIVKQDPFAIRRIFIGYKDRLDRFVAKVSYPAFLAHKFHIA